MEDSRKEQSPCPEEAAFSRHYGDFLSFVRNPMKFAELLFRHGFIERDKKDSITSTQDEGQKRLLLDSVLRALSQSSDASATLLSARRAIENSGGDTWPFDLMDEFVKGEYIQVMNFFIEKEGN